MAAYQNQKDNYINLILDQVKKEVRLTDDQMCSMKRKLVLASLDELDRLYDTFSRFGVCTTFDILN